MKTSLISKVRLERFRGLTEATLDGLAPLTILTGKNGCGKSSILEGLLLGTHFNPGAMLGFAIGRRRNAPEGARWLFRNGQGPGLGEPVVAEIEIVDEAGEAFRRSFRWEEQVDLRLVPQLKKLREEPTMQIRIEGSEGGFQMVLLAGVAYEALPAERRFEGKFVRMVDTSEVSSSLAEGLSEVKGLVFRERIDALVRSLIPAAKRLDVAINANRPNLEVTFNEYALPLSLTGDGVQAAVQLAIDLAQVSQGGLALIEEPEVFLHPGALREVAKVIFATMARGVQVVLTTHSLDLIDALASEAPEVDRDHMALFRLRLEDGILRNGRYSGSEIAFARFEIEEELR